MCCRAIPTTPSQGGFARMQIEGRAGDMSLTNAAPHVRRAFAALAVAPLVYHALYRIVSGCVGTGRSDSVESTGSSLRARSGWASAVATGVSLAANIASSK